MSPNVLLLVFIGLIVIGAIVLAVSNKASKFRNSKEEKEKYSSGAQVCIHTMEDCENCRVSGKCVQRYGKGLL